MIISRMALSRRAVLRGVGATIALPFLDAMVPAFQAAAMPRRRLGFMYMPNGVSMNHIGVNNWKPKGVGKDFELAGTVLKPLEPFRPYMVVVSGCAQAPAEALGDGNGEHTRGSATWLNAVHPKLTQGADVRAGTTADQIAAVQFGRETALPSIELGIDYNSVLGNCENGYSCAYMNTLAWSSPTTPLPTENNPRLVFERLFGDGGSTAERVARMRRDRSLLDAVTSDMKRLAGRLGPSDRARVTEYFDSIREVERRIAFGEAAAEKGAAPLVGAPSAIPDMFGDHVKLMFDLQWLAFQGDITRVFTFMWGREVSGRIYPEIGVTAGHHGVSHHGNRPEQLELYKKVNTYYSELLGYFLAKLQATPDGDGTLLDNSLILHGAGLSDPNLHSHFDLPLLLLGGAGGTVKGGRHLAVTDSTPMANLLVSMLDKVGVNVDRLGDSTGPIAL